MQSNNCLDNPSTFRLIPSVSVKVQSPRHHSRFTNNLPHQLISLPLNYPFDYSPSYAGLFRSHFLHLLSHPTQIRRQNSRFHTPDFYPIRLELVVPVQHEHVQSSLAAAVSDGLKLDLLRPARWLRRGGEVCLTGLVGVG